MSTLYCVVVTYRRQHLLPAVLDGISLQTRRPDFTLIVDNEASRETKRIVQASRPINCVYLPTSENTGPAGGTAIAMRWALRHGQGEGWITRCDDDRPPPYDDLFERLETFAGGQWGTHTQLGGVGMVGSRYDWRTGRLLRIKTSDIHGAVPVDYIPTNCFPLFRLSAVEEVGPLDGRLFFGSSEVEFGLRLRKAGYQLFADSELWLRSGERRGAADAGPKLSLGPYNWRRYYSLRNQIFLLKREGYPRTAARIALVRGVAKPMINLPLRPRLALQHLRMNVRAIRDGWTGRLGRTIEPSDYS